MFKKLAIFNLIVGIICLIYCFLAGIFNMIFISNFFICGSSCIFSSAFFFGLQEIVDVLKDLRDKLNDIHKTEIKADGHSCTALQYICDKLSES